MKRVLIGGIVFLLVFFLGGIILNAFISPVKSPSSSSPRQITEKPPEQPDTPVRNVNNQSIKEVSSITKNDTSLGKIAIVVDDLGWVTSTARLIDRFPVPVTLAVLPGRPNSRKLYRRWNKRYEFILHQPMEPVGYPEDDPGKLALMTSMNSSKIRTRLNKVLDRFPRVVGINNHMGSAFTQDPSSMQVLMDVLAERNLFFMDSLTTNSSVAERIARRNEVPFLKNHVFLDHKRSRKFVKKQLNKMAQIARENGHAIGIAHAQSSTALKVILKSVRSLRNRGYQFVYLSELARKSGANRKLQTIKKDKL
ncbi:MAG: divergent polysaccharide deacetylase family protein [bacterium]